MKVCIGERYVGCGSTEGKMILEGTPGNALGAYLDGSDIVLYGDAKEATGDTMLKGSITIHGNTGDAAGYSMKGGKIFIRDNAGLRAGVSMKSYRDKNPVLVIGGRAGKFLGENQSGGTIIVLGLGYENKLPVGPECAKGIKGGKIYIRTKKPPKNIAGDVKVRKATTKDMDNIKLYIQEYCSKFDKDMKNIVDSTFYVIEAGNVQSRKKIL
ncbi:MAG: glutamate synthase [Lachnospiraceae bacterium]|nr:glutamate synthase [Lachnospiraceae bacterium]